ncbi:MAG: ferrous iron transport protein B, partial [Anaerotignaceae bacterium]
GNPNCGKTTMFNLLTGSNQYVGNWPGVTVEKKEGKLKNKKDVNIMDLPGIYSLSPYTLEEVVTRDYIINEKPNVILNLVDASNIERNLYLTTQIMEMGIPVVVALNMMDIVKKRGDKIDTKKLSEILGCTVVETSALKGEGAFEACEEAIKIAEKNKTQNPLPCYGKEVSSALASIEEILANSVAENEKRWYSVKLFERDSKATEKLNLSGEKMSAIENIIVEKEDALDDDSESIITNERYNFIGGVIKKAVKRVSSELLTTSDKIDKIVTNRFLALPIFVLVMWFVYYVSVTTIGTMMTDWTNDVLVGEIIKGGVSGFLESVGTAGWLVGLIVDGIIGGVGAVLGFLPQMLVLFIFLAILEDCGYMARIAFIMDRIFRKFGLSGKSFIPMLIGTGCGVP